MAGFDWGSLASKAGSMGGKKEDAPTDLSQSLGQLSALRSQLTNQQPLPQMQTQDQSTVRSTVIDPALDQLISHFGIGPQKAQGEIGDLLKKGGY